MGHHLAISMTDWDVLFPRESCSSHRPRRPANQRKQRPPGGRMAIIRNYLSNQELVRNLCASSTLSGIVANRHGHCSTGGRGGVAILRMINGACVLSIFDDLCWLAGSLGLARCLNGTIAHSHRWYDNILQFVARRAFHSLLHLRYRTTMLVCGEQPSRSGHSEKSVLSE